ncbi:hypothetical protein AT1219_10292 [Vibrio alginolyticus]
MIIRETSNITNADDFEWPGFGYEYKKAARLTTSGSVFK